MSSELEYAFFSGLFGLLIGSFLNVCIYRIPRDLSVIHPRSFCPQCREPIRWYDNVPVLSYLFLNGRCRICRHAIGLRYPVVELTTALALISVALRYGWSLSALKWGLFECMVIVLFWTDLEQRILPDELTLGGLIAGLLFAYFLPVHDFAGAVLFSGFSPHLRSFLSGVAGAVLLSAPMWAAGAMYRRIRQREGLGLGDVKLVAFLGSFLGIETGIRALLIGAVSGSVLGVAYILVRRKDVATYELPFGSFLCAGAAVLPLIAKL